EEGTIWSCSAGSCSGTGSPKCMNARIFRTEMFGKFCKILKKLCDWSSSVNDQSTPRCLMFTPISGFLTQLQGKCSSLLPEWIFVGQGYPFMLLRPGAHNEQIAFELMSANYNSFT